MDNQSLLEKLQARAAKEGGTAPTGESQQKKVSDASTDLSSDVLLKKLKDRAAKENRIGPGGESPVLAVSTPEEARGILSETWEGIKDVGSDIYQAVTGEDRTTEEIKGLPELTNRIYDYAGPDKQRQALNITAGFLLAADDESRANIVKENLPEVDIKTNDQGVTIVTFPNGKKAVLNKPGLSYSDIESFLADTILFMGPAKLSSLGKSVIKKAAIGGVADAATEAGKQKLAQKLGSGKDVSPVDVGLAGATGFAGEAIPGAVQRGIQKRAETRLGLEATQVDEALEKTIKEGEEIDKVTGFGLFRPQVTQDLEDLGMMNVVAELRGGSAKAAKELKAQNKRVYEKTIEFINSYAPERVVEDAPERVVKAVKGKLEALKATREKASSKLYKKALQSTNDYDVSKTVSLIDDAITGISETSPVHKQLKKIRGFITVKEKPAEEGVENIVEGVKIKQLDQAYKDIGTEINKAVKNENMDLARRLEIIKTNLLKEITDQNPTYKQAVKKYETLSKPINELEKSKPGKIVKPFKDDVYDYEKLDKIATGLFSPTTTVTSLMKSKKIIEGQSKKAWRDITRYQFEKMLSGMKDKSGLKNKPAEMYRVLFGNPKQKKLIYAAVDPETAKTMRYFEAGLERASEGRPGGSRTALAAKKIDELKNAGVYGFLGNLTSPVKTTGKALKELKFTSNTQTLAEAIFDPAFKSDWRDLRKLNPGSEAAKRKLDTIMEKAFKAYRKPVTQAARVKLTED